MEWNSSWKWGGGRKCRGEGRGETCWLGQEENNQPFTIFKIEWAILFNIKIKMELRVGQVNWTDFGKFAHH